MYRTRDIMVNREHALFPWCDTVTALGNNMSNAIRFRQRQLITASRKATEDLTENEKEVIGEFITAGIFQEGSTVKPCNGWILYDSLMKATKNPDYFAKGLPRQSAQQVIKQACSDMENYYSAMTSYKEHPEKFMARPELPGYKRKGGHCSVVITNQDCTMKTGKDGNIYAGLPFAKNNPLCVGHPEGRLKEAEITPVNGIYKISFTFEIDRESEPVSERPERIAAIDLGVSNLMAVTNNCGLPCFLYKGGILKSANHYYNKELARIISEETRKPDCPKGKDGLPKFRPTEESQRITRHRNNLIADQMHKSAKHLIAWCVEHRIDTIVAGVNRGWKQEVSIGKVNNQNFVQIPHAKLRRILQYLCEEKGIRYVEQEESYTSKASFLDQDFIPVYGKDDKDIRFSGRRAPTKYKGMVKPSGFRGLYKASDGTIINSDLNGSANILRKAFPNAFQPDMLPDFNRVTIIRNPDAEFIAWNQKNRSKGGKALSKSKARRLKKKIA